MSSLPRHGAVESERESYLSRDGAAVGVRRVRAARAARHVYSTLHASERVVLAIPLLHVPVELSSLGEQDEYHLGSLTGGGVGGVGGVGGGEGEEGSEGR